MTTLRRFCAEDVFKFNNVNFDHLTETYNSNFYLHYLSRWPDCNYTLETADGRIQGYIIGKAEGEGDLWHSHVSAITVAPEYRRIGLARKLMDMLEIISELVYNVYFVDLFVRCSNELAIQMYKQFDYVIYRQVLGYYGESSGKEDAYDMRKALSRDTEKKSVVPLGRPIYPDELEYH